MAQIPALLALNAGSSSLRFGVFESGAKPVRVLSGIVDRIGLSSPILLSGGVSAPRQRERPCDAPNHGAALEAVLSFMCESVSEINLLGVGHRIVHGGEQYSQTTIIDRDLLRELDKLVPFAPSHLPAELALIAAISTRFPALPQVACFDTAFHRCLPQAARTLPIPRRLAARGIRRYGFHGLSYEFLLADLRRQGVASAERGRVVLAHLGSGCSMAAIFDGRCVDTTMSFTPAGGLMMGRRCGDLDPGVLFHLLRHEGKAVDEIEFLLNEESGLLGVSERSPDMRELLLHEREDEQTAEAIALFCHIARKGIGAMAAVLGGIDALVFTGGIGENCAEIRSRICAGLDFLGIALDPTRNSVNVGVISHGVVEVRVIKTDEEWMIAHSVQQVIRAANGEEVRA